MWIQPIYDRTQADVDLIRLDPTNSNAKGSFNYTDLNRIESNCEYVVNLIGALPELYQPIVITTKTDWNVTDIPTITDLNRIRNNIVTLMGNLNNSGFAEIEFTNTLDYIKANILEKDLSIVKEIISSWQRKEYICGTFRCKAS